MIAAVWLVAVLGALSACGESLEKNVEACMDITYGNADERGVAACSWVLHPDNIDRVLSSTEHEKHEFLMQRGYAYLSLHDFENAEIDYRKAYEDGFGFHAAHSMRALALTFLGRQSEALDEINEAISFKQNDANYYVMKAEILVSMERYAEATRELRKALTIRKDHALLHAVMGEALMGMGSYAEALSHYDAALSKGESNTRIHGDISFVLSTGNVGMEDGRRDPIELAQAFLQETSKESGEYYARAIFIYSLALAAENRFEDAKRFLSDRQSDLDSVLGPIDRQIVEKLMSRFEERKSIRCPENVVCGEILRMSHRKNDS